MLNKLRGLFLEEEGQGMTEYAIVLGVIAVAAIGVFLAFGDSISAFVTEKVGGISTKLNENTSTTP